MESTPIHSGQSKPHRKPRNKRQFKCYLTPPPCSASLGWCSLGDTGNVCSDSVKLSIGLTFWKLKNFVCCCVLWAPFVYGWVVIPISKILPLRCCSQGYPGTCPCLHALMLAFSPHPTASASWRWVTLCIYVRSCFFPFQASLLWPFLSEWPTSAFGFF